MDIDRRTLLGGVATLPLTAPLAAAPATDVDYWESVARQYDVTREVFQLEHRADFIAINVHKWIGNPLGVGAIYVRRGRLGAIDLDPAESVVPPSDPASRVHTGTPDYAAQLTVPDALAFQEAIGSARRAARLRALRDRWVHAVRGLPQVQVLTPEDSSLCGAITSFRLHGRTSKDDNVALAKLLLDKHRIFTVYPDGLASGCCVQVTPALATRMSDVDALATAIREIATS
jgi:isopenicillin-N epimerase